MSYSNFPNGITSMGMPVLGNGLPATSGKYIFVDYTLGSDGNTGESTEEPVKTVAQAYSMARTNKDDVIVLMGSASHVVTSMIDVSKNRVHFIGMDCSNGRYFGQNAKLTMGVTTAATDIAVLKNTGIRNTFTNIKFVSNNTVAESLYAVAEGGEYAEYTNCEIYKSTDLDETGAAELLHNGDSTLYRNCTIGSLADALSGTIIRPCVLLTRTLSGKVSRDSVFENCFFWRRGSHVNNRFVYAAADADVERLLMFKNCHFIKAANSAAVPAQAIGTGASLTVGLIYCDVLTTTNATKLSAATGVFTAGVVPTAATSGLVVNAA